MRPDPKPRPTMFFVAGVFAVAIGAACCGNPPPTYLVGHGMSSGATLSLSRTTESGPEDGGAQHSTAVTISTVGTSIRDNTLRATVVGGRATVIGSTRSCERVTTLPGDSYSIVVDLVTQQSVDDERNTFIVIGGYVLIDWPTGPGSYSLGDLNGQVCDGLCWALTGTLTVRAVTRPYDGASQLDADLDTQATPDSAGLSLGGHAKLSYVEGNFDRIDDVHGPDVPPICFPPSAT